MERPFVNLPALILSAALLLASAVASAQSPDIYSVNYVMQHLRKGVTTPDDVLRSFGTPHRRDVRASSEGEAEERFVYLQGGAPKPKREGGGLGRLFGAARGVMGDVAGITGSRNPELDRALGSAGRIADRVATVAPAAAPEQAPAALTLTIVFSGGVLKSYDMN